MKSIFNLSLFLFALIIFSDKSFSFTNYQIRKFCKNEERESICIKKLQEKKTIKSKDKFNVNFIYFFERFNSFYINYF